MKIVISCSNKKNGGNLIYKGNEIFFVSKPNLVSKPEISSYFKPDDIIPNEERTWRDYTNTQNNNELLKAFELYKNPIYKSLYDKFKNDLYILSAGWGIINSEFRIPKYNITFSKRGEDYTHRENGDNFNDFNDIESISPTENIIFFGGSDYLRLFYDITKFLPNKKIIFYKKKDITILNPFLKDNPQIKLIKCETKASTNWHYGCAKRFLNEELTI